MLDRPDVAAILGEVAKLLKLGSASAFDQKVAANAVSIAMREIALAEDCAHAEQARLHRLLGLNGTPAELNAALCAAIRSGDLDWHSEVLMSHLRATAREKLKVDQPSYPAFRADHLEEG